MAKLHGVKFISALLALLLFTALALPCPQASAASALDPTRPVTLTVNTMNDMPRLKEKDFDVSIWRVATNENGMYTLTSAFDELEFMGYTLKGSSISTDHNDTISGKTRDFSYACYERVLSSKLPADAVIKVHEGTGSASIQPGYYLIVPGDLTVTVGDEIYRFDPALVALPHVETIPASTEGDPATEDWVYDITVSLKPETDSIRGKVKIVKILNGYNETLEGADFIFRVRATKNGKLYYSNVISLHFDKDDWNNQRMSKEYVIDDLPIGALVEVEEFYSGSAYELVDHAVNFPDQLVVVADPSSSDPQILTFTFWNSPDDHVPHGTSALNHYEMVTGEYGHKKMDDSTQEPSQSPQPTK